MYKGLYCTGIAVGLIARRVWIIGPQAGSASGGANPSQSLPPW